MNFVMCTRTNKYYSTSILIPYEQGLKKRELMRRTQHFSRVRLNKCAACLGIAPFC